MAIRESVDMLEYYRSVRPVYLLHPSRRNYIVGNQARLSRIVFPILYSVLVLYCIWRIRAHRRVVQGLPNRDPEFAEGESYTVMPTVAFSRWNVVKRRRTVLTGSGTGSGER